MLSMQVCTTQLMTEAQIWEIMQKVVSRSNHLGAPTQRTWMKWVVRRHGFVPETAWIEHCKQLFGVKSVLDDVSTINPCPPEHQPIIRQAFVYFCMLPDDK